LAKYFDRFKLFPNNSLQVSLFNEAKKGVYPK
jgi:hypothetical protein